MKDKYKEEKMKLSDQVLGLNLKLVMQTEGSKKKVQNMERENKKLQT
jgi:hypothetical protein